MNKQIKLDKKDFKVEEGIYIPSIEAHWLYHANMSDVNNYIVKEEFLNKLLNGKLDYSFELIENKSLIEGIEIEELNGKLYTLDVVNVKYNKKYIKDSEQMTIKELRDWTYENGFKFNGKLMSNWKRSTGKAKEGDNMFILDSIKDDCLDWARMELKFEGNVDIGSIRAYESLPLSSIHGGSITINPENILVIEDISSKFSCNMSKTWLDGSKLKTDTMQIEESNSIFDGEGMLSEKIFNENEFLNKKGVALIRNRYMKCAGFNCKISKFFQDYCDEHKLDYETYKIKDMYGNEILVKSIELITTPSAIKIAKYNDEVCKIDGYTGEGAWLRYWKERCGSNFAICKIDNPSHNCIFDSEGKVITYRNVLSYQMINSIQFKKQELSDLIKKEIEYVGKLKNDLDFFLEEAVKESEYVDIAKEDEEEDVIEEEFQIGASIDVTSAFVELCRKNSEFEKTQVFKDYRRNYINSYVNKLRAGKIHIDDSDYAIVCGNPIELLYSTVGEYKQGDKPITLKENELCCSRFSDFEDIVGFRSPHVMISNCGVQVNRKNELIEKYMNMTDNIVYFNAIDYPIQSTYSGLDYDIDSVLLTKEKLIVGACKRIDNKKYPVPHNAIENTGKNNKEMTALNMSKVDSTICQNYIGQVINMSQELNSLMNHKLYNFNLKDDYTKEHEDIINELYNMVSKANAISNVEIDKSKKQFENLNVPTELRKMKQDIEVVDNIKVRLINDKIRTIKKELMNKNKEIMKYRSDKRKPHNKRINKINDILRINDTKKLTDEEIKLSKDRILLLKSEIKKLKEDDKEKIKPINKEIREIEKILREDETNKLTVDEVVEYEKELEDLKTKIDSINIEKENEINTFKNEIKLAKKELSNCDKRRIKPYFFKFIGDTDAKKQRSKTNVGHRKELDRPIIEEFAKSKGIEIKDIDKKEKELKKLLKANDKIQKEWEDKVYITIDTPMDWLENEIDAISSKEGRLSPMQVIKLVKNPRNEINKDIVNYIVKNIKNLDTKLTGYKMNSEISYKDRCDKIKSAKEEVVKNIKSIKISKANLYGIMKNCLNSAHNNGKVDKKSGIESISLELLFKAFGTKLLDMFI